MKKTLLAAIVSVAALTAGCAHNGGTMGSSADSAGYESALADAKAAQKKAAGVGGEWRDTGEMISSAEAAAAAGDYAKATSLAQQAAAQGELGYEQAMGQQNVGNPSYLY